MDSDAFIGSVAMFVCGFIAEKGSLRLWEFLMAAVSRGKCIVCSNGFFITKHWKVMLVLLPTW